jgi:hypothetical protein
VGVPSELFPVIPKGMLDERLTDEPPPKMPNWLVDWERSVDLLNDWYDALDELGGIRDELGTHGITINITYLGVDELTPEQDAEKQDYDRSYGEWEERNPVVRRGWMSRTETPLLEMITKQHIGDYTLDKATWGWTDPHG